MKQNRLWAALVCLALGLGYLYLQGDVFVKEQKKSRQVLLQNPEKQKEEEGSREKKKEGEGKEISKEEKKKPPQAFCFWR